MPKALIIAPSFFGFSVYVFFLRPGLALVLTGARWGHGAIRGNIKAYRGAYCLVSLY